MRLRPIGPGIGGLNYAPLLKESRRFDEAAIAARQVTQSELSTAARRSASNVWLSIAAAAKRFGDRYCQSRLEQAEEYIARHSRVLALDSTLGRERSPRYY